MNTAPGPEFTVRSEGQQVVMHIEHRQRDGLRLTCRDFPLSTDEALSLASTLYSIAVGIEAVKLKEERVGKIKCEQCVISNGGTRIIEEPKPETWRDRESML